MQSDTESVVHAIKLRLKEQQSAIGTNSKDETARLVIRAELDALWACVEVLAQRIDGKPQGEIEVRDYWSESDRSARSRK